MATRELVLDTGVLSQMFFENSSLWAVVCSLSSYNFCHALNVSLRLNLIRRSDLDLRTYFQPRLLEDSLFFQQELESEPSYFPVYRQYSGPGDPDIILYTNKHNGSCLIPNQGSIDFFLLVKNAHYCNHLQNINVYLRRLRQVSSCTKVNVEAALWTQNLIL